MTDSERLRCKHDPPRSGWDCQQCGVHLHIDGAWWWIAEPEVNVYCSKECARG